MAKYYVVYWENQLRDGREDGARVYDHIEKAIIAINNMMQGFGGENSDYKLFELGKEIPLTITTEEVPQPSVKKNQYVVKEEK